MRMFLGLLAISALCVSAREVVDPPPNETVEEEVVDPPPNETVEEEVVDPPPNETVEELKPYPTEDDMRWTDEQLREMKERKGITTNYWTRKDDWGNFAVPYYYADSEVNQTVVEFAMLHWEENTCFTFWELTTEEMLNATYPFLNFVYKDGCYSYVGMVGNFSDVPPYESSGQDISIGYGCATIGTVAHELGHAIGLQHEQTRSDRDDYVLIHFENIDKSIKHNFEKQITDSRGIDYDYSSLMHYYGYAFSNNSQRTITTLDPLMQYIIGKSDDLSYRDILLVNTMYGCIDKWAAECEDPPTCLNGGYVQQDCSCDCPPPYTGDNCDNDTANGDYYADIRNDCDERITAEGSFGYGPGTAAGDRCAIEITAPECHIPVLTVTNWYMYKKLESTGECYFQYIAVRQNITTLAEDKYCATDLIVEDQIFGSSNKLYVFYFSQLNSGYHYYGMNVTFEPAEGCGPTTMAPPPTLSPPVPPACQFIEDDETGYYVMQTPNYGNGVYPSNFTCSYELWLIEPAKVTLGFVSFELEGDCNADYLSVKTAYDESFKLCGTVPSSLTYNFFDSYVSLEFWSDGTNQFPGFAIYLDADKKTGCHRDILLSNKKKTGFIKSPDYRKPYPSKTLCAYHLKAPKGKKIIVYPRIVNLRNGDYLFFNKVGDSRYPRATTVKVTKSKKAGIKSKSNEFNIGFFGWSTKKRNKKFLLAYKMVKW